MKQIIHSCPDRLEVECASFVGGRDKQERDVLVEGSTGQDVETGVVETVRRDLDFASAGTRSGIYFNFVVLFRDASSASSGN